MTNDIREKAIQLLSRREHSRLELKRKLLVKGFLPELIESLLDDLSKNHLQSDDRFVENYVRSRRHAGFGPKRIAHELQERGVAEYLIHAHLSEDHNDWWPQMIAAWKKRFSGKEPLEKQYRFLFYRGYAMDAIRRWLRDNKISK